MQGIGETGVWVTASPAPRAGIAGTLIGKNAAGAAAVGNSSDGIRISAPNDFGTPAAYSKITGNAVSGNARDGLRTADGSYNDISGNTVGLAQGVTTTRIANLDVGVMIIRDRRSSVRTNRWR